MSIDRLSLDRRERPHFLHVPAEALDIEYPARQPLPRARVDR